VLEMTRGAAGLEPGMYILPRQSTMTPLAAARHAAEWLVAVATGRVGVGVAAAQLAGTRRGMLAEDERSHQQAHCTDEKGDVPSGHNPPK